jgi:peptide/nickel transport system permease protein
MMSFIGKRSFASAISLIGLIVLVFFLSRLTGDPTSLYLPLDASLESREQFREIHGLNDPLIVQFGRYISDLMRLDFGESLRKARPALDVVLEAFPWTLMLAFITMALVTGLAIIIGSLAAFKVGGFFDRLSSILSLIGSSAPDFWVAIVAIFFFLSVSGGCRPRAPVRRGTGCCPSPSCSSGRSALSFRLCAVR